MRFRLRTLLIVLAVGPVVLAMGWWEYAAWKVEQERRATEAAAAAEAEQAVFSFSLGITR